MAVLKLMLLIWSIDVCMFDKGSAVIITKTPNGDVSLTTQNPAVTSFLCHLPSESDIEAILDMTILRKRDSDSGFSAIAQVNIDDPQSPTITDSDVRSRATVSLGIDINTMTNSQLKLEFVTEQVTSKDVGEYKCTVTHYRRAGVGVLDLVTDEATTTLSVYESLNTVQGILGQTCTNPFLPCTTNAKCDNGVCACDDGFYQSAVNTCTQQSLNTVQGILGQTCTNPFLPCTTNAKCDNGVCACDDGFYQSAVNTCTQQSLNTVQGILGQTCTNPFLPCTTNAKCNNGVCACDDGFYQSAVNTCTQLPAKPCDHKCCIQGKKVVKLGEQSNPESGFLPGLTVIQGPTIQEPTPNQGSGQCNKTALIKVNFKRFSDEPCDFCLTNPYCGRRMLRIDLDLSYGPRKGFLFSIGDSVSNHGGRGDDYDQENDAVTEGKFPDIKVYLSEKCSFFKQVADSRNAIGPNVNHVTIYVSNGFIRITNDAGLDREECYKECLYALNGQTDNGQKGGINEDIYIALNRVVRVVNYDKYSGYGVGVCSATFRWTCPWERP